MTHHFPLSLQQHEVQRSAFASDLLPSPFFPNAAYPNGSAFAWPTSAGGTVTSPEGKAEPGSEQQQPSDGRQTSQPHDQQGGTDPGSGRDSGAAGESGWIDGPNNGLDDLSQAAQVLSEGRRSGLGGGGGGDRTHPRSTGEGVAEGAGDEEEMGRGKRRKT